MISLLRAHIDSNTCENVSNRPGGPACFSITNVGGRQDDRGRVRLRGGGAEPGVLVVSLPA